MKIEQLREFIVFAKHLNFTKAAAELYLTQPALSNHIAGMERELGFQLVLRGNSLSLTPAGKTLFAWSENMLNNYDQVVAQCEEIARGVSGLLTIEQPVETTDIKRMFEKCIFAFSKAYPSITVRQVKTEGSSVIDVLKAGKADIGVVFDQSVVSNEPSLSEDFSNIPMPGETEQARYLWIHKDHPVNKKPSIRIKDLDGSRVLVPANLRYREYEQFLHKMADANGISLEVVHRAGSRFDSALRIGYDEIEILSSGDIEKPVYNSVDDRVFRKLDASLSYFQPCFIYLASNENPALPHFRSFVAAQFTSN